MILKENLEKGCGVLLDGYVLYFDRFDSSGRPLFSSMHCGFEKTPDDYYTVSLDYCLAHSILISDFWVENQKYVVGQIIPVRGGQSIKILAYAEKYYMVTLTPKIFPFCCNEFQLEYLIGRNDSTNEKSELSKI